MNQTNYHRVCFFEEYPAIKIKSNDGFLAIQEGWKCERERIKKKTDICVWTMQQKAGRRREMCNTGRTFISSVTSSNFHWHNVTPFARPTPLPTSLFFDLLSRDRGFVLEDPRNGLLFRRHRLSTSSFASLTINLPTGPFIRSPRERWYPGIHYRRCVDITKINESL